MQFHRCTIEGLIEVVPDVFEDDRGHFLESYNERLFQQNGIHPRFVQDNQSFSTKGVIRGLHYQLNPFAQSKLVRVLSGVIRDVVVDIRPSSATFGHIYAVELSADNRKQLFVPAGFAHGFSVLSDTAIVCYKCDQFYHKESEGGIRFNDHDLAIDWGVDINKAIVSDKDRVLPLFRDHISNF